jgi:hypothetical protein
MMGNAKHDDESRCCNYRRLVRRRFSLPPRPRARTAKPSQGVRVDVGAHMRGM